MLKLDFTGKCTKRLRRRFRSPSSVRPKTSFTTAHIHTPVLHRFHCTRAGRVEEKLLPWKESSRTSSVNGLIVQMKKMSHGVGLRPRSKASRSPASQARQILSTRCQGQERPKNRDLDPQPCHQHLPRPLLWPPLVVGDLQASQQPEAQGKGRLKTAIEKWIPRETMSRCFQKDLVFPTPLCALMATPHIVSSW